ncbi:hypothetical protein EDB85DRAFT_1899910 [Lactarius pseudohatsudake]|nr:hypothetical protein EDB85DRAFT_1899910 [Lactarius pseudohatsudake]
MTNRGVASHDQVAHPPNASAFRNVIYGLVWQASTTPSSAKSRGISSTLTTAQIQIPGPADRPYATPRPILLLMMPLCIFWRDGSVNGRVAPDGDIRADGSAWAENACVSGGVGIRMHIVKEARMTTLRGLVAVGSVVAGELLPAKVVDGIEYAKLKSRGFVRVRERDHEFLVELLGPEIGVSVIDKNLMRLAFGIGADEPRKMLSQKDQFPGPVVYTL